MDAIRALTELYYSDEFSGGFFHVSFEKPEFKVGDHIYVGLPNKYDLIAIKRNIKFSNNPVVAIPSNLKKFIVEEVYEGFQLKKGISGSYLTRGDYSGHPDFDKVWKMQFDQEELFYELADFLKEVE